MTHTGGGPLEGESWWMAGMAGGRNGATRNVQTSIYHHCRQQAPPMRRYLNDGATRTLAVPIVVDTRVDSKKLRNSHESNTLGSTMPSREPVKRRTSRRESSTVLGLPEPYPRYAHRRPYRGATLAVEHSTCPRMRSTTQITAPRPSTGTEE